MSPCPCCGKNGQRNFLGPDTERTWVTPCGACVAYLRITRETLEIQEESIDALDELDSRYKVAPVQYETLVPRDDDTYQSFKFSIPPTCAVCSSPEAPLQRQARVDGYSPAAPGITDALLWKSQGNPVHQPSHGELLDDALKRLVVQVCEKHAAKTYSHDPLSSSDGVLSFVAYRYYKAFCELNQMAGPQGAAVLVAAAKRPERHHEDQVAAKHPERHHDDRRVRGRKPGS